MRKREERRWKEQICHCFLDDYTICSTAYPGVDRSKFGSPSIVQFLLWIYGKCFMHGTTNTGGCVRLVLDSLACVLLSEILSTHVHTHTHTRVHTNMYAHRRTTRARTRTHIHTTNALPLGAHVIWTVHCYI